MIHEVSEEKNDFAKEKPKENMFKIYLIKEAIEFCKEYMKDIKNVNQHVHMMMNMEEL